MASRPCCVSFHLSSTHTPSVRCASSSGVPHNATLRGQGAREDAAVLRAAALVGARAAAVRRVVSKAGFAAKRMDSTVTHAAAGAAGAGAADEGGRVPMDDDSFFVDRMNDPRNDAYVPLDNQKQKLGKIQPVERVTWYWRIAAFLTYLVPAMDSLDFVYYLLDQYRSLDMFFDVVFPLSILYQSNGFTPLIIFFALFIGVVRNFKVPHFVRYHTMQSILLDIVSMLGVIIKQYMPYELRITFLFNCIMNVFGVVVFGTIAYCMLACVLGKYADIPVISEGVYMQLINFGAANV